MSQTIKHLVFDMGGVLVQLDWHGRVSNLLGKDIPFEEIHSLWGASKAVTAFESGETDFDTFATTFIAEQNLTISKDDFENEFRQLVQSDFPGVNVLLLELKENFTLSLLSNTNAYHWQMMLERNTFLQHIENPFTSIEFGVMKPDPVIFTKLISALKCRPEEILFFDDGLINIEAALKLGLNAAQVFGPDDIVNVLKEFRLYK